MFRGITVDLTVFDVTDCRFFTNRQLNFSKKATRAERIAKLHFAVIIPCLRLSMPSANFWSSH